MAAKLLIAVPSDYGGYAQCLNMPSIIPSQKLRLPARRSQFKRLEIRASSNTFGTYFRVTTFKESHGANGASEGCVIDGCLRGLPLSEADIQVDLDRLGQSRITTPRKETDICKITSGIIEGLTTGAPIKIVVPSTDQTGHDGRSAGETIGKVAAGSVAKKVLKLYSGTEVYSNFVRCPNPERAEKMVAVIDAVRMRGESAGGMVTCIVRNIPQGLGSLGLHKLEVELAKAFMSLPATKGFELVNKFAGPFITCSEHGDEVDMDDCGMRTKTNLSGGIQVGVSNGEIIKMIIAFKPEATIYRRQNTVSRDEQEMQLVARGLHNVCAVPHACLMVQAMAELVVVDQLMAQHILD